MVAQFSTGILAHFSISIYKVKAREGKMAYVRPEYHDRIMRITRVIGHDRLSLSAYIDHVLTHHFNQCEEAIKSLYARNYDAVF